MLIVILFHYELELNIKNKALSSFKRLKVAEEKANVTEFCLIISDIKKFFLNYSFYKNNHLLKYDYR